MSSQQQQDQHHSPGSDSESLIGNGHALGCTPPDSSPPLAGQTQMGLGAHGDRPIPPIRVQSGTPCPPSTSQTPIPQMRTIKQEGLEQTDGGYSGSVEPLPALSSQSCAVTNGKPPEVLKNGLQQNREDDVNGSYGDGSHFEKNKGKT
ncbi:uncharacterized protein [Diadema setosum]|uniref:uncharacterized protein n=1 Tax=Diadema setosum TaxID=31175 RepID=UPI003B3ACF20